MQCNQLGCTVWQVYACQKMVNRFTNILNVNDFKTYILSVYLAVPMGLCLKVSIKKNDTKHLHQKIRDKIVLLLRNKSCKTNSMQTCKVPADYSALFRSVTAFSAISQNSIDYSFPLLACSISQQAVLQQLAQTTSELTRCLSSLVQFQLLIACPIVLMDFIRRLKSLTLLQVDFFFSSNDD